MSKHGCNFPFWVLQSFCSDIDLSNFIFLIMQCGDWFLLSWSCTLPKHTSSNPAWTKEVYHAWACYGWPSVCVCVCVLECLRENMNNFMNCKHESCSFPGLLCITLQCFIKVPSGNKWCTTEPPTKGTDYIKVHLFVSIEYRVAKQKTQAGVPLCYIGHFFFFYVDMQTMHEDSQSQIK